MDILLKTLFKQVFKKVLNKVRSIKKVLKKANLLIKGRNKFSLLKKVNSIKEDFYFFFSTKKNTIWESIKDAGRTQ